MARSKVTLDTQLVVGDKRESLFRHLEDGRVVLVCVTGFDHTERTVYLAGLALAPNLYWEIRKESYTRYTERRPEKRRTLDYDAWTRSFLD